MALLIIFLQWIIKSIPSENTTDIYFILFLSLSGLIPNILKLKKEEKKKRKEKKLAPKHF